MSSRLDQEFTGEVLPYTDLNDTFDELATNIKVNAPVMDFPIGSLVAWHKDIVSGLVKSDAWLICDGSSQTLPSGSPYGTGSYVTPDLRTYMFMGATTGGGTTTGTHTHSITGNISATRNFPANHLTTPAQTTGSTEILPPHMEVVWLMKVV